MYQYQEPEIQYLRARANQFRSQVNRFKGGELPEEKFTQFRLRNGLYKQKHAHMLRVAIPYGQLNSIQLQKLAEVSRKYDRGYGHFTTRQNIQFNWPELDNVPVILEELATVGMHAIQTSGSCIRNITTDHLAGISADEVEDPRPWCELLRQWSTLHPEFYWLPRKFKIAVTGASNDRTALKFHDIGIHIVKHGEDIAFNIWVGGGMGRTPVIGKLLKESLLPKDLLAYLEATIRVYNRYGRRDNKYKSRIKILVNDLGLEAFSNEVEQTLIQYADHAPVYSDTLLTELKSAFKIPQSKNSVKPNNLIPVDNQSYRIWIENNLEQHAVEGFSIVHIPLKAVGETPGDMDADTMDALAVLAREYSRDEIRVTHEQNLVLPYVENQNLFLIWSELSKLSLATPNIGKLTDMIACPGLDYCSLANASTIPLAKELSKRFEDLDKLLEIGDIKFKMSGCMNACGHHHAGHIGILGVDKKGKEWYQITLGGSAEFGARIGERLGPAVPKADLVDTIAILIETYLTIRLPGETFLATVLRTGTEPFKKQVYEDSEKPSNRNHSVAA